MKLVDYHFRRLKFYLTFFAFLCCLQGFVCQQLICENRNPEGHTPRKTEGDGGFRIVVVGNHSSRGFYSPNDVYTVTIQGLKTRYSTQKFTEFLLVAESEKQLAMGQSGLMTTGIFHIIDDSHSRFSDMCPDGVTNTNMQPKTEISVLWTAPSTLVASCVTFKATVVERPHIWYKDDGQLTRVLCPEMPRRMRVSGRSSLNRPPSHHLHQPPLLNEKVEGTERTKVRRNHNQMAKNEGHGKSQRNSGTMPAKQMPGAAGQDNRRDHLPRTNVFASNSQTSTEVPAQVSSQGVKPTKCCACDEAKYEVRFEGIWSKETHPKDFPENEWLLHFSDIIGASHSPEYHVWKPGEQASEGIRQVAEWGATRHLETEIKSKSRFINTIIKAKGLWHPEERGITSAAFRVDKQHHLMSLVSMIGPSPDWIVGITAFDLCLSNCTWLEEAEFDLYPYDAGTDSGITYMSPNTPTEPRENIRPLTSTDPDDPRSPFYGVNPMKPFAKAHIRRQRIYPKGCNDTSTTPDVDHEVYLIENSEDSTRPECAVSDWTAWSDCSVTCGKGLRMRKRSYMLPMKADMFRCDRQLVEKEMCLGEEPSCPYENTSIFEEFDSVCAVTPWSDWTPCSVTCGKGTRSRFRRYKNHMGRKKCNLDVTQTEMCVISMECLNSTNIHEEDENCPMTPWSQWTPCSVTCGIGIRERTRFPLLTDEHEIKEKCSALTTSQRATCTGEFGITCTVGRDEAKEICALPPDVGSCRSNETQYYFSIEKSMCVPFEYSGCKGNRNRFPTQEECKKVCGFLRSLWNQPQSFATEPSGENPDQVQSSPIISASTLSLPQLSATFQTTTITPYVPITTTRSNPFTEAPSETNIIPTTSTAQGVTFHDLHNAHNDLSDGDTDDEVSNDELLASARRHESLAFEKKALPYRNHNSNEEDSLRKSDCVVSRWSSWSPCSVPCGTGVKTRERVVLIRPNNGGKLCPRLQKRKNCRMDPCLN